MPPGPGMQLKQPSPEYCQAQVERYKRVVGKVQELADVDELMQEYGEHEYGTSPQHIGTASSPESESRTVTHTEYLLMLEQERKTIEKMSFYLDRVKKEAFSVDNDEVISDLSEWMDRYHQSYTVQPEMTVSATREWFNNASDGMEVIQQHLMLETDSGMLRPDRALEAAQKEYDYWESRCETKRVVPHLDYCQSQSLRASEQVLVAERELADNKKQLIFYQDYNQAALELRRENSDAGFTFEISDLESKVKRQEHTLDVARSRFEYWQDECNRLRDPKKITAKNVESLLNVGASHKRHRSKRQTDDNTNVGDGKSLTVRMSGKSN